MKSMNRNDGGGSAGTVFHPECSGMYEIPATPPVFADGTPLWLCKSAVVLKRARLLPPVVDGPFFTGERSY